MLEIFNVVYCINLLSLLSSLIPMKIKYNNGNLKNKILIKY